MDSFEIPVCKVRSQIPLKIPNPPSPLNENGPESTTTKRKTRFLAYFNGAFPTKKNLLAAKLERLRKLEA